MTKDIIQRRRTFAIIAHPDAGKTTLTEKLLLFGGAIAMAGEVKSRKANRAARSDWMKVEQERGISVSSSVMTFEYRGCTFNLLDTPGHEDFSEDTYRVLTAVDSAVMVIDNAKGIEEQTRKLFEVCRLRDIPIITFINKMDRDGQDPFALLQEIEETLALDTTPATWPIGMGRDFKGCYDILHNQLNLIEKKSTEPTISFSDIHDSHLKDFLPNQSEKLIEDVDMVRELCPQFNQNSYLDGTLTPVFFGSAVNNFGVKELLDALVDIAPSPRPQQADIRSVDPTENQVSGFIFKIQANMDPKHRDRIAFMRLCSGHFKAGMKLKHLRTDKQLIIHNPILFMAQSREIAQDAYAGDIIGIQNHGNLVLGDTLTEKENIRFKGIPSFAPELLQKVRSKDPLKSKHLSEALLQIAQEGGASVFKPLIGNEYIVGVVGALQFQILADRIRTEYNIEAIFESTSFYTARWIEGEYKDIENFITLNRTNIAYDYNENPVFLTRNAWHLNKTSEDFPKIKFQKTKEYN